MCFIYYHEKTIPRGTSIQKRKKEKKRKKKKEEEEEKYTEHI